MIRFYYSPDGLYKEHNDFITSEASESFVFDKSNNKIRLFDSTDFYFQTLSDNVDVNNQNSSVGLSQKGAYLMKSAINSSISKINTSISDVNTRLSTANTNISRINTSIGKITNDLAQHVLDCDATHTEFSETWAAALTDIRREIDGLNNRLTILEAK